MLILLSPAKNLDFQTPVSTTKATEPLHIEEATALIGVMQKKSAKQIGKLMKLSQQLSDLNYERYQTWTSKHDVKNARPALLSFNGSVYQGVGAKDFNAKELEFAQQNMAIISGLYGVLRPLDLMQPYRLEMGTKLKVRRKKNLYEFWGTTITESLNELAGKDPVFINLASNEYFKAVKPKELAGPVINCAFKEFRDGKYKAIMTYAKLARGYMANYIVKNQLKNTEDIKGFNVEGYEFNANESTELNWVFTR